MKAFICTWCDKPFPGDADIILSGSFSEGRGHEYPAKEKGMCYIAFTRHFCCKNCFWAWVDDIPKDERKKF